MPLLQSPHCRDSNTKSAACATSLPLGSQGRKRTPSSCSRIDPTSYAARTTGCHLLLHVWQLGAVSGERAILGARLAPLAPGSACCRLDAWAEQGILWIHELCRHLALADSLAVPGGPTQMCPPFPMLANQPKAETRARHVHDDVSPLPETHRPRATVSICRP